MSVRITIIEQLSASEVIVNCARCNGTGRVYPNDTASRPCWICNGKGKLLIEVERLPLVECARCNGTGRSYPNDTSSHECDSCGGAGCQPIAGTMSIIN